MYILHFKVFLAEKSGGRGGCFKRLRRIVCIEMREIVFFLNTVNSRYLKVEIHPKLLIFQSNVLVPDNLI